MYIDFLKTPIGWLEIQASSLGVTHVLFIENRTPEENPNSITKKCKQELEEYFNGTRKAFTLPLDQKGTDFQLSVWKCLEEIPFGQSLSYQDIALKIDRPKAMRAVGTTNGKNPISIIVPCHRVIGSNQRLTGYAGGLDRKAWLLNHEGISFKE